MGAILGIFTSKLTGPIASVAAAILLVFLLSARGQLSAARGDLEDVRDQLSTSEANLVICKANTDTLNGAVTSLNGQIEMMAAEGVARTADAQDRIDALSGDVAAARRRIAALLNSPLAPEAQSCSAALDAIRGTVQ